MEPTLDEYGAERHPAWVLVGASRGQWTPPGAVLFDSDIRHTNCVTVRVKRARRKRSLHHDWKGGGEQILEFVFSEAQWASFVSSMNTGDGVPATLTWDATTDEKEVPGMPFEPRLQESIDEVRGAATEAQETLLAAFEAYTAKKSAENLRSLEYAIRNMPANMVFAANSLSEHAENVVQRARADVEAFVANKAAQLGLEPGDLGGAPQLTAGEVS